MTCTVFPISSWHICLVKAQVLHVWDWQIIVTRAYTRSVVKPNDERVAIYARCAVMVF